MHGLYPYQFRKSFNANGIRAKQIRARVFDTRPEIITTAFPTMFAIHPLYIMFIRGISQLVLETHSTFLQWSRFEPKVTFNPKEP